MRPLSSERENASPVDCEHGEQSVYDASDTRSYVADPSKVVLPVRSFSSIFSIFARVLSVGVSVTMIAVVP